MILFDRSFAHPAGARHPVRRALTIPLAVAATLLLMLALAASPASAIVTSFGGQKYGLEPHATTGTFIPNLNALQYSGGPVMHANSVYAIYWDPAVLRTGDPGAPGKYQGDWQQLINGFLKGVGAESGGLGNVFALTGQYTESGGARAAYKTTFRGAYVDHHTYPSDGCTDPDQSLNKNFACFSDLQLREELGSFIAANKLHAGKETVFYLLTPPGVTVCIEAGHCSDSSAADPWGVLSGAEKTSYEHSFCSYHSTSSIAGGETAVYAAIPWTAGTLGSALKPANANGSDCQDGTKEIEEPNQAGLSPGGTYDHALPDLIINQIASQQVATVTNPMLTAWYEPLSGNEVPDQCRNWFEAPPVVQGNNTPDEHTHAGTYSNQTIAGSSYYLNTEYNQAALYNEYPGIICELHSNLAPSFTAPNPVNAGDVVGFDGNESDITLEQSADPTPSSQPLHRAVFTWNFGDGTTVSGPGYSDENPSTPLYASVFHTYQYGGTYEVTLTVNDAAANSATVTKQVTVVGPLPPSEGSASGGSGSTSSAASGSPAAGAAAATAAAGSKPPLSAPVATAAALPRSLRGVLSKGLPVRYSVNQQVAGHFEVLLSRATARRLKIGGAPATGLPAGTSPQVVIAKAILVTTAAGRSTVTIHFSKHTASRLEGMRSVPLMLRLVVRNASSQSPATTTVLSRFILHR